MEGDENLKNEKNHQFDEKNCPQKSKNLVKIKNLSFRYEKTLPWILQELDFCIEEGKIYAIAGANGSGKSTLLYQGILPQMEKSNIFDQVVLVESKIAGGSYPQFDLHNINRKNKDFIFYKPVLYRQGTTENYVHAVVYLELSTQSLIDELDRSLFKIISFGKKHLHSLFFRTKNSGN